PVPDGFRDIADLNRALAQELRADARLIWEPLGRTTRGGQQAGNLLELPTPALRSFLGSLRLALDRYIADLGVALDTRHPFDRNRPASYGIDIWSTILRAGGHQDAHIHTSGWLSGVYYVQLPDAMGMSVVDNAGWIEFGRPPDSLRLHRESAARLI